MPIYEYTCTKCGHKMEAMQKMNDAKLVDCPACNEPALEKQISAASFRLKGTGWYETDFKDKKPKPSEAKNDAEGAGQSTDKPTDKSTDKSGDKSGDKPAAKSESKSADSKKTKPQDT